MGKQQTGTGCEEYDALVNGIEEAKAQVKVAGKKAVTALLRKFLDEHHSVKAIGWVQYTPYFNDGEPCEFRVGDLRASLRDGVDYATVRSLYDDDDDGELFQDSYDLKDSDKKSAAALDALGRHVSKEVFEAAFGDHVMVIATREGFHVSEYDHE